VTKAQELIEEALRVAHQENGVSLFTIQDILKDLQKKDNITIFKIQEALGTIGQEESIEASEVKEAFDAVLGDVNRMVEDCRVTTEDEREE
jgi:hypothetical protein